MENNKIDNFVIRNPSWIFYLALAGLLICLSLAVTITVLYCIGICKFLTFIIVISISCVFLIAFLICIFAYFKERFVFNQNTFTYVKTVGKPQSVNIENLSCVNIYPVYFSKVKNWSYVKLHQKGFVTVEMIDKDSNVALKFTDNGVILSGDLFGTVLVQNNIIVNEILKEKN